MERIQVFHWPCIFLLLLWTVKSPRLEELCFEFQFLSGFRVIKIIFCFQWTLIILSSISVWQSSVNVVYNVYFSVVFIHTNISMSNARMLKLYFQIMKTYKLLPEFKFCISCILMSIPCGDNEILGFSWYTSRYFKLRRKRRSSCSGKLRLNFTTLSLYYFANLTFCFQ